MNDEFKNLMVEISITDPWEFQSTVGKSFFKAKVIKAGVGTNNRLTFLVKIESPPLFKKDLYEFIVIESSLEGLELETLLSGAIIPCGMIRISTTQAKSQDPLNTSWWRGGHSLIGSIKLYK